MDRKKYLATINNERYVRIEDYFLTNKGIAVMLVSFFISYILLGFTTKDLILKTGIFLILNYILMIFFPAHFTEKENAFYLGMRKKLRKRLEERFKTRRYRNG